MIKSSNNNSSSSNSTTSMRRNVRLVLIGMAAVFWLVELVPELVLLPQNNTNNHMRGRRNLAFFNPETTDPKDVAVIPPNNGAATTTTNNNVEPQVVVVAVPTTTTTLQPHTTTTTTTPASESSQQQQQTTQTTTVSNTQAIASNNNNNNGELPTDHADADVVSAAVEFEMEGIEHKADTILADIKEKYGTGAGGIARSSSSSNTVSATTTTAASPETTTTSSTTTPGIIPVIATTKASYETTAQQQQSGIPVPVSSAVSSSSSSQGTPVVSVSSTTSSSTGMTQSSHVPPPQEQESSRQQQQGTQLSSLQASAPTTTTTTSNNEHEPSYTRLCRELVSRVENGDRKEIHEPYIVEESLAVCETQESYAAIGTMYLSSLIAQAGNIERVWYNHNCARTREGRSITSVQQWFPEDLTFGVGIGQSTVVDRCRKCLDDMKESGRIVLECMGFPNPGQLKEPTDPMIHAFRMAGFRHNVQQAARNFKQHELQMSSSSAGAVDDDNDAASSSNSRRKLQQGISSSQEASSSAAATPSTSSSNPQSSSSQGTPPVATVTTAEATTPKQPPVTTTTSTTVSPFDNNHKTYGGAVIVLDTEMEMDPTKDKSWIIPFHVYEQFLTNTTLTKGIMNAMHDDDDNNTPSSIAVLVTQRCIDSNPLCRVHGQELVKRLQNRFPSNCQVSGEIVQSTASLYGRIMDAPFLMCPTPTMTCLLPSMMREYSRTTVLTHSPQLYDWYRFSHRESVKILHAPVVLHTVHDDDVMTPLVYGEKPAQSVASLLDAPPRKNTNSRW